VLANLALLAFMLGFTFGLAVSRFDVRRGLVIDGANAIGTTSLRGGQLPEPHRTEVRTMILRDSVRRHRRALRVCLWPDVGWISLDAAAPRSLLNACQYRFENAYDPG
jgi:hypothetical protein